MADDYADRFGGLGRLFGQAALARLRAAHACVIGLGGVGSWAAEGLARSGVGRLTLVDLDDVCLTNVNRQLPALDGQVGRPKVAAMAERLRLINPAAEILEVAEFFTETSADRLLEPTYDCVIDAIDVLGNKARLIAGCVRRGLLCVTVGGAGGRRDATQIRAGDLGDSTTDELLRIVRKKLRRDYGFARGEGNHYGVRCVYSAEKPFFPWTDGTCNAVPEPGSNLRLDCDTGFGTAVFVTGAFGLAAAGEAVRLIAEGRARADQA
jgi:tRNA A37 threonylcarbamoyladenosine dehydratase